MVVFDHDDSSWAIVQRKPLVPLLPPVVASSRGVHTAMVSAEFGAGFSETTGPLAYLNLLRGYRFATPGTNDFELNVDETNVYSVILRFRNFHEYLRATLICRGLPIFAAELPITFHDRNGEASCEVMLESGCNSLQLVVDQNDSGQTYNLMVLAIEAVPVNCTY